MLSSFGILFLIHLTLTSSFQLPQPRDRRPFLHYSQDPLLGDLGKLIKLRESCPPEICIETIISSWIRKTASLDVIHWLHPIIMTSAVIGLAGAGLFYSQQLIQARGIRQSEYRQAKQLHSTFMSILLFFMIIGSQSGLSSMLVLQQPLLDSPHAVTAVAAASTLTIQAILGSLLESVPSLRTVHRYVGGATLAILGVHLLTGLSLGFSLPL